MNVRYVEWLDAAAAAGNAYVRWSSAPPEGKAQVFAACITALTEEAAKRYGQAATELKRQATA